jgi:glycosyltransferase involved in cell wall biosynthesis
MSFRPVVPAVVIPVYNHAGTLRAAAKQALAYCNNVIVVDDGSTDDVNSALGGLEVTLLTHAKNLGKGAAICTGARKARELGFTHIITIDADGQHKAEDIPHFIHAIQSTPEAVIIGARDFTVPHIPASSCFGRKFSWFWMFVQTGVDVSDMQSGFRAYPVDLITNIPCRESRYSFEIEIIVRSAWAGFLIREIPVHVWYPPKSERISHFKAVADNLRISLLNTKLTVRALIPVPFPRTALKLEGQLSLKHPWKSLQQLVNMKVCPGELSRSASWSVFVSLIPLLGFQTMILLFAIHRLKLNRLCALLVVPLTWPPILPGIAVLVGYRLLHGTWLTEFSLQTLGYEAGYRFADWMIGSMVIAVPAALLTGGIVYILSKICAIMQKTSGKE